MENNLALFFSDRTEILRDKFLREFNHCWQQQNPFSPPTLLVPNKLTSKWLAMEWAKEYGIAMMFDGQFLDSFLWQSLIGEYDDPTDKPIQLTRDILELWIVDLLTTQADEELEAVINYIGDSPDRTVQIAQKLARLLLEYELARPKIHYAKEQAAADGLIASWLNDNDYFNATKLNATERTKLEAWQRTLYVRLFGPEGYQSTLDKTYLSLPQLVRQLESNGQLAERLSRTSGQSIFLWSAGLSAFHRDVLAKLAAFNHIYVYQLNPCSEFWEDVDTSGGNALAKLKMPEHSVSLSDTDWAEACWFESDAEMPLLKAWGHIGKENIKLWCQQTDYDFEDEYSVDHQLIMPDSLLRGVQYAVLNRQSEIADKLAPDGSIRLVEVPNRRREVEVLQGHLLSLMAEDDSLRLSDIGVLMPDPNDYRADFDDVFGSVANDNKAYIPWVFADESAGSSQYAKGVTALCQLLKEPRFDRRAVFNLLRNPLVQASFSYDSDMLIVWESWCEKMGAYYGYDDAHRHQIDQGLTSHNIEHWHTFRSALDRLLLGRLVIDNDIDMLPYKDWYTDEGNCVELFVDVIENLYRDLAELWSLAQSDSTNWTSFGVRWNQLLATWLVTESFPEEAEIANSLNEAMAHITAGDVFAEGNPSTFSADTFFALVNSHLDTELPSRTNILTGRLTITALREGRPIPWKHTFVLGMSAGKFPAGESNDPLDLRSFAPLPGDYTASRQARYMFLELLMCTRESLTISWQNYDLANDRPILPSSIIVELEDFVRNGVLKSMPDLSQLVADQALLPDEDEVTVWLDALKTKQQKELAEACFWPHLHHAIHADEDYGPIGNGNKDDEFTALAIHTAQMQLGKVLLLSPEAEKLSHQYNANDTLNADTLNPDTPTPETSIPNSIKFAELQDFLINPINMVLQRQLGLYNSNDTETTQVTDEPIEWDKLTQGGFRHDWLQHTLEVLSQTNVMTIDAIEKALDDAFGTVWNKKVREGKTPKGLAAEQLRQDVTGSWKEGSEARGALQSALVNKRLTRQPAQSVSIAPVANKEAMPATIAITDIPAYYQLESGGNPDAYLLVRGGSAKISHSVTYQLLQAIQCAANSAEDKHTNAPSKLMVVSKDSKTSEEEIRPYPLTSWTPQEAKQWLSQLIAELHQGDYQKHNIPLDVFSAKDLRIAPDSFTSDHLRNGIVKSSNNYYPSDILKMFDDAQANVPEDLGDGDRGDRALIARYAPFMAEESNSAQGNE